MAYTGSVELISGIRQKNGQDFPLVDASAVRVDDETRLDDALDSLDVDLTELQEEIPRSANVIKREIIDGYVAITSGSEIVPPLSTDFSAVRITPKNGVEAQNGAAVMNVNGSYTSYYTLASNDFISDNVTKIESQYNSVMFVLFCYSKSDSSYIGAIYTEYTFKSAAQLEQSNMLYPYTSVNMNTLREMFPDFKFRIEITDTAVNHETPCTVSDITSWCTYTVPISADARQLVLTVNGVEPDENGNVDPGYSEDLTELQEEILRSSNAIKQEIINGYITIASEMEEITPSATDYSANRITPKNGVEQPNGSAIMNINGSYTSYYTLTSNNFLSDDVKSINSKYDTVMFILFCYNKTDSSYVGAIYRAYDFKTAAQLEQNNMLYPYTTADMDALRELFPDYKFRIEITDTAINSGTQCTSSDITSWCTYGVPVSADSRRLVLTVDGVSPDANGNISLSYDDAVTEVKQEIIDGLVSIVNGTETVIPSADDFTTAAVTPKSGLVVANKNAYMNINGTAATYYPLLQNGFVPDDVKSIDTLQDSVMFILFCYNISDSSYAGAIYKSNEFKTAAQLESNNTLYPYTSADMDVLRASFPNYLFRIEITDINTNGSSTPVPSDITSWCTYTVNIGEQRTLVKTVNNVSPDANGNINVEIDNIYSKEIVETGDNYVAGKWGMGTGNGNSASEAVTVEAKNYVVLGIRMTTSAFVGADYDYIKVDENAPSIYFYVQAWDESKYVGFYHEPTHAFYTEVVSPNRGPTVYNILDISYIHEHFPTYDLKISVVDISTAERISTSAAENIIYGYSKNVNDLSGELLERVQIVETNVDDLQDKYGLNLPSYFETQLTTKIASIKANMESVGRNGQTFVFITDLHWSNNKKRSPALVKRILDETNVTEVICGGDMITEGTYEESEEIMMDCINSFKNVGITFPVCFGNHDSNWNNYADQWEHPERHFTENNTYGMMEAQYTARKRTYFSSGFNFYVDIDETNTRLIFVDTGEYQTIGNDSGVLYRDYDNLADVLNASEDRNIIIIAHSVTTDSIGSRLCRVSNKYNAREVYNPSYCNVDFRNARGHIYGIIGGHCHYASHNNIDGLIPYITVDTDSLGTHSDTGAAVGTVNEQGFDVITVDYTTGTFKIVGIGRCTDRTIYATSA